MANNPDQKNDFRNIHGIKFNPREALCLEYLSKNFDIYTMAEKMGLAHRTVSFYLKGIMLKLKCDDMPQLLDYVNKNK